MRDGEWDGFVLTEQGGVVGDGGQSGVAVLGLLELSSLSVLRK